MPKTLAITALAAVLLGVLAVSAVATHDEGSPPSAGYQPVTTIDASAYGALSVLRSPRAVGDALPSGVAQRMQAHSPFGLNPDLSRRSIANTTNSVYVIPAAGHVCVSLTVNDGASLSCSPTAKVAAGTVGGATTGISDDFVAIYGVVPDGVATVALDAGTFSRELAVESNAYYTVVPATTPLRSLSYSGPSGQFSSSLSNPRLVFGQP